jgi:molybdopterin-guanine dinucleotide biosynthesis protein A
VRFKPPVFSFEICVLAGGLSRRMGRDKARVRLGNRTMLGHVKKAAKQTGKPFRVISKDLIPGTGPLGGIYTALKTTLYDGVLFLACDMPFITAELLSALIKKVSKPQAVFTKSNSRFGFPFFLRRENLICVEKKLQTKNLSLNQLAKELNAKAFRPEQGMKNQLSNVNTRMELKAARNAWRRVASSQKRGA